MSNENAIATTRPVTMTADLPSPETWHTMMQMAETFITGGLLPDSIKTPQAAITIMQKGRELAVPPMYALSNIAVVNGKPTCSAELMAALIERDHGTTALIVEETTNEHCTVSYWKAGWDKRRSYSFTMDDARTAGLNGKGPWKAYPAAMLRARCLSAVARLAFQASIAGMYTPEELGANVTINADGEAEIIHEEPPRHDAGSITAGEFRDVSDATDDTPPQPQPTPPIPDAKLAKYRARVNELWEDATMAGHREQDIIDHLRTTYQTPTINGLDLDQLSEFGLWLSELATTPVEVEAEHA